MKIKRLNIIMFLFLLLIVVGFSPPYNNSNINNSQNTVYAVQTSDSFVGNLNRYDAAFANSVEAYINQYKLFENRQDMKTELINNLDASIGRFNDYLDVIVNTTKTLMTSLCVLTIAIIGFKYMNSGTGNLINFIKSKEKLANTALAMVFVLAIPTLISGINGISVQVSNSSRTTNYGTLGNNGNYILSLDTAAGSQKIENVFVTPSSYLTKVYTEDFFKQKVNFEGKFSSGGEDDDARFLSTGGFLKMIERFLLFLLKFIYMPFHFIINIIGIIGFYPMSFDPAMYDETIVKAVVSQLHGFSENTILKTLGLDSTSITSSIVGTVASAFQSVIIIINLIAGILKKICLAAVDFACYFFGLKVLLGVEATRVKDFLYKLLQGVLGMFAAPFIVQTLIDIDAIVSAGILGLAGNALPGIGMMNLIMIPDQATYSLLNFIFACGMLAMMVFIVQAFFFRRIELIMYYLAAPAVFLKHIFEPRPFIVMKWIGNVASASFVTTTYAPLFVTVNFLIKFGGALEGLDLLLYYAIIWFIIYKGKDITLILTDWFFGGQSVSDTMMRTKMQEGLEYTKNLPGNVIGDGMKAAGKMYGAYRGITEGFGDALAVERENNGGIGSLLAKTAMGALVSDKIKAGTDAYTQSFSNAKENNWYNKHLSNKEAMNKSLSDAGLDGHSQERRDESFAELKARNQTLQDKKMDNDNYRDAYREVANANPNMDRDSQEFKDLVKEVFENKGINSTDKVNFTKGRAKLDEIFENNKEEFATLSDNELIDKTLESALVTELAQAHNINVQDSKAMEEFRRSFESSFVGAQLAEIEKAKREFNTAQANYNAELAKPASKRDDNVCLDALRTMDKSKDIISQAADIEKLMKTKISTTSDEQKLKQVEVAIQNESKELAKTLTEITKVESALAKMQPDDADYSKISAQLSELQTKKATHETNRNIKVNTRSNLEQKINTNRDVIRQSEVVITAKSSAIEKAYSTSDARSVSEEAYRQEVGKHTYSKVRVETTRESVTNSSGQTVIDSNGNPVTREIKVKRDSSGEIRKDSRGTIIDYSKGSTNRQIHDVQMKTLNDGISQVTAQNRYESGSKPNNDIGSKDAVSSMDKIIRANMREQMMKGNFHNHKDPHNLM